MKNRQQNRVLDTEVERQDVHKLQEKEANRILLASVVMVVFTLLKEYNTLVVIEILAGIVAYIGTSKYDQNIKAQDYLCILSIMITGTIFIIQILPYIFLNIGW